MTPETPSPEQAVVTVEKRSPEGRQRPYKVLRALAQLFTIFAPILPMLDVYNSVVAWFVEETLRDKAVVSLQFAIRAVLMYLFLKAAAQMIYLVFDIARGVNKMTGEGENGKS